MDLATCNALLRAVLLDGSLHSSEKTQSTFCESEVHLFKEQDGVASDARHFVTTSPLATHHGRLAFALAMWLPFGTAESASHHNRGTRAHIVL